MRLSLPDILTLLLRPWAYGLAYIALAIGVLLFVSRSNTVGRSGTIRIKATTFAVAAIAAQLLAAGVTVVYVGSSLGWNLYPAPSEIENLIGPDLFGSWFFVLVNSFSVLGLGMTVVLFVRFTGIGWVDLGLRWPETSVLSTLVAVAGGFLAVRLLVAPIGLDLWGWVIGLFETHHAGTTTGLSPLELDAWIIRHTLDQAGAVARIVLVLWIALLSPLIEELFFRGLVLTALRERFPSWAAVAGQAALFAAMHLDPIRVLYLFGFGLVLGYLVKRSSSLVPAILVHVAINTVSVISAIH